MFVMSMHGARKSSAVASNLIYLHQNLLELLYVCCCWLQFSVPTLWLSCSWGPWRWGRLGRGRGLGFLPFLFLGRLGNFSGWKIFEHLRYWLANGLIKICNVILRKKRHGQGKKIMLRLAFKYFVMTCLFTLNCCFNHVCEKKSWLKQFSYFDWNKNM